MTVVPGSTGCPAGAILRVARGFCEYVRVAHAQESEKMRET